MYLNLITPLIRIENLDRIYASIPDHRDIHWIIVYHNDLDLTEFALKKMMKQGPNKNISFIRVNFEECLANVHLKMQAGFKALRPGFFQGLDDDTVFNENTYDIFHEWKNDAQIVIGKQAYTIDGEKLMREAQPPQCGTTDGGQALIRTDIVKQAKLGSLAESNYADCEFLIQCWNLSDPDKRILVDEVISLYNALR